MTRREFPRSSSAAYFRERLEYDPSTGVFRWKRRPQSHFVSVSAFKTFNTRDAGTLAGSTALNGYRTIRVDGVSYLAHRLAWLLSTGEEVPAGYEIDHIDGTRANNRIANLRLATRSENNWNSRRRTNLPKGVHFDRSRGLFVAYVTTHGRRKHIGRFNSADEASAAVCAERILQHGAFAKP